MITTKYKVLGVEARETSLFASLVVKGCEDALKMDAYQILERKLSGQMMLRRVCRPAIMEIKGSRKRSEATSTVSKIHRTGKVNASLK